jgi:ABC-type dipeptide/oligopeptide/nickel transport system ATPase component
MPNGCRFQPRCAHANESCQAPQVLQAIDTQHRRVRCGRAPELDLPGVPTHG